MGLRPRLRQEVSCLTLANFSVHERVGEIPPARQHLKIHVEQEERKTVLFRTCDVPDLNGLQGYVDSVSSGFCPYIRPSTKMKAMHNTVYTLDEEEGLEASIFYLGLLHTEILRDARFSNPARMAVLSCENLIFRFATEDEVDGKALFAWPHWLLKIHYTEAGVLFGKFWLGEEEASQAGIPIPPPPYHVLSIRSAIIKRDPQFFQKAPELLGDLLESDDDGRDVMKIADLLVSRPTCQWQLDDIHCALEALQRSGLYETMKDRIQREMEAKS